MNHIEPAIERTALRNSVSDDIGAIADLHKAAFGRDDEAHLVQALMQDVALETLSFVAERRGRIIGHILLSAIDGPEGALALAPLSVDPDWRDMQIGSALVRHAIITSHQKGWKVMFVLGDANYYGRFGFRADKADCAVVPWQGAHFQALELKKDALKNWSGDLIYPNQFYTAF